MGKPTKPAISPIQSNKLSKCDFCVHYGCRNHNMASLEGLKIMRCGKFEYKFKRDHTIKVNVN